MKGDVIYVIRTISPADRSYFAAQHYGFNLPLPLWYRHYGINVGDGSVIHFTGEKLIGDAIIKQTSMSQFRDCGHAEVDVMVTYDEYTRDDTVKRAMSKLGSDFGGYNIITNNCEHFAYWCATGKRSSRQVGFYNDPGMDIAEKAIENVFEPLIKIGMILDDFFGW